jgi:energy-coupling factor transporter ATP-binding protein EcfA2
MKTAFSIDSRRIIVDYSSVYCETVEKLLKSKPFEYILQRYLQKLAQRESPIYDYFSSCYNSDDKLSMYKDLVAVLRLLTTYRINEIVELNTRYAQLLQNGKLVYEFVEGLYDFWRSYERYIVMTAPKTKLRTRDSIHHAQFIKANETLRQLILRTYRTICENLIEQPFRVYRQLPAGAHIGLLTQTIEWDCPVEYQAIQSIPFIRLALLEPPVIFYPRMNKRSGLFNEVLENPLSDLNIQPEEWFCYPAKIGKTLAFAYFHQSFMSQGTSLANLFELAQYEDIVGKKPDLILMFGAPQLQYTNDLAIFHHDRQNQVLIGYEVNTTKIDYFGYMKKMLLTLHNVTMLERNKLPLHGAMVSIRLKSKASANVIIIGDSGAGKSETLEAFRILAQEYISDMTIIFDDMGSIEFDNNEFKAFGTEIGAFLRLDDLQPGYAFEQLDRSIFMSPNLTNARVILPVTKYSKIIQGTSIDYFLYANNYEKVNEKKPSIEVFDSPEQALEVFNTGKRIAKGTTSEKGLVESYFANPFGAPQRKTQHETLAVNYINKMFKLNIIVGQIRTQLGREGYEQTGPQEAAKALFANISKNLKLESGQ